jgi:hypothetical protein
MTNLQEIGWHVEFAKIIACELCTFEDNPNLLRDSGENVPQPGFVGDNFAQSRVMLIGLNPGTLKSLAEADQPSTVIGLTRDPRFHPTLRDRGLRPAPGRRRRGGSVPLRRRLPHR